MFLSAITERRISVDGDWRIRSPEARAVHRAVPQSQTRAVCRLVRALEPLGVIFPCIHVYFPM